MKTSKPKAGDILFHQGDDAEHLYILVEGRVEFPEIGASIGPGQMFGEIAFFAPERKRTLSARCAEDCTLLSINQSTVRELYYQNPGFGFEIVGLVASRLSADIARLRTQLQDARPLA
jgi:CRP-like cAMP-binding protein